MSTSCSFTDSGRGGEGPCTLSWSTVAVRLERGQVEICPVFCLLTHIRMTLSSGGTVRDFFRCREDPEAFSTEELIQKAAHYGVGISAGMVHIVQSGFVHRE
jgi:hypothetical protein